MSGTKESAGAGQASDEDIVVGLRHTLADQPAAAVFARVAWNGPVLDPDRLTASEFLGALP